MSSSFSVSNPIATLECHLGCRVELGRSQGGDADSFEFSVQSPWYAALISALVEPQRLNIFKHDLGRLAAGKSKEAGLINAHGNLELKLVAGTRGDVSVTGTICKDMSNDEQIAYELEADLTAVSIFHKMLTDYHE